MNSFYSLFAQKINILLRKQLNFHCNDVAAIVSSFSKKYFFVLLKHMINLINNHNTTYYMYVIR